MGCSGLNASEEGTLRQKMFLLLQKERQDARSLSQQLKIPEKEVSAHMTHVAISARQRGQKLRIISSECFKCGFSFKHRNRLTKPSRCPRCRGTHISAPAFEVR